MKAIDMKPGKNGYKIVFAANTVVMNYKFAAAAGQVGTEEYNIMKQIREDFPGMAEITVSGREQKSPRKNSRLTYANMEQHIKAYDNSDDLMEVFKTVKTLSKTAASPYKYVADWFVAQFPDYKKTPVFKEGKLITLPIPAPNVEPYKVKKSA